MAGEIERLEGDVDGGGAAAAPAGKDGKPDPAGKKKKSDKTAILVILSAAGVFLAFLTFRKSSSASATAPSTLGSSSANDLSNYPTSATDGSGYVAGYGGGSTGGADDGYATLLSNLENFITTAGLPTATTPVTSTSSGTTAKPSPVFQYGAAGKADKYLEDESTGTYYQVQSNGSILKLTYQQWNAVKAQFGNKNPPGLQKYNITPPAKAPAKAAPKAPAKK